MSKKLELVWEGKETPLRPEPRILIENPELSYSVDGENVSKDNILIHGDNLLALKALEKDYSGKVKCIYIDPPYNTGKAFEHYDDNFEHSIWLSLMKIRFELLHKLLKKEGFLFVTLDEAEHAYGKVVLDEIFGRQNYIGDFIWQKRRGGGNDSRFIALDHDYILVYAKDALKEFHKKPWKTSQSQEYQKRYKEVDENGKRYYWDTVARDGLQNPIPVSIKCPDGSILSINSQISQKGVEEGLDNGMVKLTKGKKGWSLHHRVYMKGGQIPRSILDDVGTNKTAGDEMKALFGNAKAFDTPKPELLIKKLIELTTEVNDIVLDSFLGSGTTIAVAQKMNRKWIGVEMGEHAYSLCKVRLDKVISGEDKGGITKDVNYQGGGSYKFYELAPTLIVKNALGIEVINKEYNAEQLAAAVALHEGYNYQPDENIFWKQSKASENSYLFVTTSYITPSAISQIEQMMGKDEYLLIACKAFDSACEGTSRKITIKKIPQMLLKLCEFGKDDYSLNIINPPVYEDEDEE